LAKSDLPDGFGFDQFSLMVRSEYAVPLEANSAAETVSVPPPNPDAMDISPSTPDRAETRELGYPLPHQPH
jgi:hypothetical protein